MKKLFSVLLILGFVLGISPGTTTAQPGAQDLTCELDAVVQADDWLYLDELILGLGRDREFRLRTAELVPV